LNVVDNVTILVNQLFVGGAGRVAAHLSRAWTEKGRKVTILTTDGGERPLAYGISAGVVHAPLGLMGDSRNPIEGALNNLRRLSRLRRAIAESRPDVLISFLDKNNVMSLLATRGLPRRIPTLVSERTDPSARPLQPAWEWLRRKTYPWADGVVVQSAHALAYFSPAIQAKGWIIPNPVVPPTPPAEAGEASGRGPRRSLITLGRLSEVKGHDLLLTAFAAVAAECPDWDLTIHGEGPERAALEAQVGALGLEGRVRLPGSTDQVYPCLRAGDLFVLPSRAEGFPNALAEAMATGLPVVSFDCHSGPSELIRHGVDGLLVPPLDVEGLAAALIRLMKSPGERAALGERAKEVLVRFSEGKVLELWETAIQSSVRPRK
jgi:glycosyltransferase involved in cell wall biosynthesis